MRRHEATAEQQARMRTLRVFVAAILVLTAALCASNCAARMAGPSSPIGFVLAGSEDVAGVAGAGGAEGAEGTAGTAGIDGDAGASATPGMAGGVSTDPLGLSAAGFQLMQISDDGRIIAYYCEQEPATSASRLKATLCSKGWAPAGDDSQGLMGFVYTPPVGNPASNVNGQGTGSFPTDAYALACIQEQVDGCTVLVQLM